MFDLIGTWMITAATNCEGEENPALPGQTVRYADDGKYYQYVEEMKREIGIRYQWDGQRLTIVNKGGGVISAWDLVIDPQNPDQVQFANVANQATQSMRRVETCAGNCRTKRRFTRAASGIPVSGMRLALLLALFCTGHLAAQSPSSGQRALIDRGYGMFIHFGINTFNQTEWSDGSLPVASYHPTALDCDQWIRTAKEAGFRHVVLTTKHHDGFCLWDSAFTDYDVASSPIKTDVIVEVAKACRKYHVQLGLYYSLWDRHEPSYREKDPAAYADYMKKQLTELLTNYGDICELWFDGSWARPVEDWHIPELYAHIKSLQPNCQVTSNLTIFSAAKPAYAPLASEQQQGDPIHFFPSDFRTKDPSLARRGDPKLFTGPDQQLYYLPFEHTIVMSDRWNWFQKKDPTPARSTDELEEMFYWCTAQDNAFLLNVPPGQDGRLRDSDVKAVLDLADRLHIRGGDKPLPAGPIDQAAGAQAEADSTFDETHSAAMAVDPVLEETRWAAKDNAASITLTPAKPFHFDRVVIHEYAEMKELGDGFSQQRNYRVQSFILESLDDGKWSTIHTGSTIGAAKIIRFPEKLAAEKLRLHLTSDTLAPSITDIAVEDSSTASLRHSP